jgi:hypothetical protein
VRGEGLKKVEVKGMEKVSHRGPQRAEERDFLGGRLGKIR